jgi:tetratricopeptide (TPR) repeat protein/cellulose synthase/poly-beta-1,6-N-acetylglucosamine synthase-like glycosyltransferase/serine acetyltransferase
MIHCIGDSHVYVFSGTDVVGGADVLPYFKTYRLGPHTAYNAINRRTLIEQIITTSVGPGDMIMFVFGEIDCRAHLLKEAELQKRALKDVVMECVDRYFELFKMAGQYGIPLLAWNSPASSREDIDCGEYSTYGSCKQRNEVTELFNRHLKHRCEENGVIFLSVFDKLIDKDGITNTACYLDAIHLSQTAMPLILDEFRRKGIDLNSSVSASGINRTSAKSPPRRVKPMDAAAQTHPAMNIVYEHFREASPLPFHRGNVSVVWSALPLEGFDVYAYLDAYSFRGKQSGIDVLIMLEPMVVLPGEYNEVVWRHFDHIFSLCDALSEYGHRFTKILFPRSGWAAGWKKQSSITRDDRERNDKYPLDRRINGICMINGHKQSSVASELYSKRYEIARWFGDHSDIPFDIFGSPPFDLPSYKGALAPDTKLDTLCKYRYCLCFENTNHPSFSAGYITEKILDCLETRTVPIYLGSVTIEKYIPPQCFIDFRKFAGYAELHDFIRGLKEEEYNGYIRNIDAWISNGGLLPYSWHTVYDQLVDVYAAGEGQSVANLFLAEESWTEGISPSAAVRKSTPVASAPLWGWHDLACGTSQLPAGRSSLEEALNNKYTLHFQNPKSENGSLSIEFLRDLSRVFGLDTFIETGTYLGDTSCAASKIFSTVHTIELSAELHQKASDRFRNDPGIHVHHGDSGKIFPKLLGQLKGKSLFWLDGHYSEGITAKGDENTPVLKEIRAIKDSLITDAVILIDDLRFFDTPWNFVPHNSAARGYPSVVSLCKAIREIDRAYQFAVIGDVFMACPPSADFEVTALVAACSASRFFDEKNSDLQRVMEAEEEISKAQAGELLALQNLFATFVGTETYGLGKHYRLWHALILAFHQHYMKACKEFLIAINLGFDHWRVKYYLARSACDAGYYTLAKEQAEAVLTAAPDYAEARQLLQRIETSRNNEAGETAFSTQDHIELAQHYRNAAQYAKAVAELDAANLRDPGNIDVHYSYATLYALNAQHENAIVELRKVLKINPDYAPAHNVLGQIYISTGEQKKALDHFKKVVSLDHKNYAALCALLNILAEAGNFEEAAGIIQPILEESPDDANLLKIAEQLIALAGKEAGMLDKKASIAELSQNPATVVPGGRSAQSPAGNIQIMSGTQVSADTRVGDHTYIGYHCSITRSVIGRYCSIANHVSIGQGEHDVNRISTSSLFYENPYQELTRGDCIIGNDVWIGVDSIIKRGVTIGDGAVIGANSFVSRDIPAYAIAAGSPAKIIRFRFSPEIIASIKASNWWNYELEQAKQIIHQLEEHIQNEKWNTNGVPHTGPDQEVVTILFSKDRAMQLDCTLRSFLQHCRDSEKTEIKVLYTTSGDRHESQYRELKAAYPSVEFFRERDFKIDLLSCSICSAYLLFLVDDNIFVKDFSLCDAIDGLEKNDDAIGFSLRLGNNTDYCYMLKQSQKIPGFRNLARGVSRFEWTEAECDFGYPMEVSSSIYRTCDILALLQQLDYRNPNTLELALDANKHLFRTTKNYLLCFDLSVAFCNPINMVQNMWKNRAGQNLQYSAESLALMFDDGYRIDSKSYSGFTPGSCHQEVELHFVRPGNLLPREAPSRPLVSIIILHQNGLDNIRLNLESIRRNTPEPHEVIIFDNGSSDGSRDYLRSLSDIILIESPDNIGCTPGRARAMSAARGRYLILLDNDTIVTRGWVTKFIQHAQKNPHIGLMGPCSNYVSGPQLVPNTPYRTDGQLEAFAEEWSRQHRDELVPVSRLVGFCMFISRELFEKIGVSDETLGFFGFDDDDYSLRAFIAGFNPSIARDIFIHHTGGPQGRGDQQVNRKLLEAWECYKRKWGIDQALPFGNPWDMAPILAQPFDPLKHYCRPYPASVMGKMTPHGQFNTHNAPVGARTVDASESHTEEQSRRAQKYFAEGNSLMKKGDFAQSVKAFQAAIDLSPHNAQGCFLNMGYALKQQGKIDEAIQIYEKAVAMQPDYADAYCNLGNAYKEKGELERAVGCYEKALAVNPADEDSLYNLGNIFRELGKFDEAIESYRKAVKIKKDHLDARNNLCVVLKEKGSLGEAEKCCRKLIKMAPDYPDARWNLALIQLLSGRFEEGWKGYEWRWKKPDFAEAQRGFPQPLWTGSNIDGKTILIHAEQGYGDVIQFIRYAPMIAERGTRVMVECQHGLKSLIATVEGVSKVFARGEALPDFDVHCPILSLPGAFATTLETIPATIPYIAADLSVFNRWREKIQADSTANLKVGIAWAGSPGHKNDKNRSCPFDRLLPLFSLKNVTFYSLQINDGGHSPTAGTDMDNLVDHTGEIHDFLDTAGFIQNLDLVLSVDTAVAHLAGALGKEVWVLLPFAPDWRWMREIKDSPWYPTMKLFRQDRFGNWQGVIEQVRNELENLSTSFAEEEPVSAQKDISKKPIVPGLTSIIIHGLSNLKNLKGCLERIHHHTSEPFEVIFAENNCPAETRKWLKKQIKTTKKYTYESSSNPVLAHAINRGISASSGEYIVLLSSDVMVSGYWLPDLLACLKRTPAVGIVGPMMNADQGRQKVGNPNDEGMDRLSAFSEIFRDHYRHRRFSARTVSGYCMMFKRDLADHVGPFDDNPFFGQYAFADYCSRTQMEGYRNTLCGDVYVHVCGGADRLERGSRRALRDKWSLIDKENHVAEKISCQMQMEEADRLILHGKTDQAINTLIQSIGQHPGVKDLYYALAELLLENRRYEDAIGALHALPSDETDARIFEIVGYCNEGLGFDLEAGQSADRALSLTESARAYNLKGVLAFKAGDIENAGAYFQKAMECDPGYGEPYTNTGVLRWSTGEKLGGIAWMEKGFILSPQVNDVSDRYYSALMDLGQYSRGETILGEAKHAYPGKKIIFLLIDSLLKQDKYEAAMAEAEDAIMAFGLEEGMLEAALKIRSKIGPKTIDQKTGRPSLSLCMIVKNEEPSLAKCLSSVKHIVDEMIVVDTGSGDRTKDIALAYGATLYDYEWTNSFADARNYSLMHAQGDWVLLLDGDEVISESDHPAIRKLIKNNDKKSAYSITTRNYLDQVSVEGWTPNDDRYYREAAGCGWMPSEKVRIFPNLKSIRFENPVHEFVESSLAKASIRVRRIAVPIHHYGKLNREKMQAKEEKYYQLGIRKLEEKGNDLKSLIEIAIQAAEAGKYDDALLWWRKVIEIDPNEAVAYYNMGSAYLFLKRYAEAIDASKKSIELYPHRKEAVTNLAVGEIIGGDNRNAIRILETLINGKVEYPIATGLLAIAYCIDDRTDSGLKQIANLKKMNFRFTPFVLDISQRMVDAGRNAEAIQLLEALIDGGYADYELVNYHDECVKRCTYPLPKDGMELTLR